MLCRRIRFSSIFLQFLLALDYFGYRRLGNCSLSFHNLAVDHLAFNLTESLLPMENYSHNICTLKVLSGSKHLDQEKLLRLSSRFSSVSFTMNEDNVYLAQLCVRVSFAGLVLLI